MTTNLWIRPRAYWAATAVFDMYVMAEAEGLAVAEVHSRSAIEALRAATRKGSADS